MAAKRRGGTPMRMKHLSVNTTTDRTCDALLCTNKGYSTTNQRAYNLPMYRKKRRRVYEINQDMYTKLDWLMYTQLMWVFRPGHRRTTLFINIIGILLSITFLSIWAFLTFQDYIGPDTLSPSVSPTHPTHFPSVSPTHLPSLIPSVSPTSNPTPAPTHSKNQIPFPTDPVGYGVVLTIIFAVFSRLLAMCYFVFKFKTEKDSNSIFPWYNFRLKYNARHLTHALETYLSRHRKRLGRWITSYIMGSLFLFSCWMVLFIIGISKEDIDQSYSLSCLTKQQNRYVLSTIDGVTTFFGVQFPMVLFPIIWSVIAFKFQFRLHYLQCLMNESEHSTQNFVLILKKYKQFYGEFRNVYKFWKWHTICYICFYCVYVWTYIDVIVNEFKNVDRFNVLNGFYKDGLPGLVLLDLFMVCGTCAYSTPLLFYTLSSAQLNYEYHKFLDLLWKYDDVHDEYDTSHECVSDYTDISAERSQSSAPNQEYSIESNSNTSGHLLSKFGPKRKHGIDGSVEELDMHKLSVIMFNSNHYHVLLNYVPKYPIQITVFSVELTPWALLKFVVAFATSRFVAQMVFWLKSS